MRARILIVVGTRPEVIKMAPVVRALRARSSSFDVALCIVGQQNRILEQALDEWRLDVDARIDPAPSCQDPAATLASVLVPLQSLVRERQPALVLVHGDTTTTLAGGLAAFYAGSAVAHVEAGLRTGNLQTPFPEEMHRALVDRMAEVLYAPTPSARDNLIAEGCDPQRILVVGNTVIDALELARRQPAADEPAQEEARRVVLVTGHRRENFGRGLDSVCRAVRRLVLERNDVRVIYVLHPHPQAHRPTHDMLFGLPGVELIPPLGYARFVAMMERAHLILTDSGGIQEEAPWLGKPVLVTRELTERPEAVRAGVARLVGLRAETIVESIHELLDDPNAYRKMASGARPFGEAGAAERICRDLAVRCSQPWAS